MRYVSLTRAEAEAELANIAGGCLGSFEFRLQAERALDLVRFGMPAVQVGHTTYCIREAEAS